MNPYYQDDHVTVHAGDCLDVMAELPDASVDAVVTDPPYGLDFMGKHWDDGAVAFDVETWRQCLRLLKPGGHIFSFGGTRTFHRMAVAIEDAGFEIRDSIAWLYGSGFPKSLDVSKAIDKGHRRDYVAAALRLGMSIPGRNLDDWTKEDHAPGDKWWVKFREHLPEDDWARLEREVVGSGTSGAADIAYRRDNASSYDVTSAATDLAKQWQGWGTALKPAFEPIVVGRKPLRGTVAANVVEHGTGALNIAACRVEGVTDFGSGVGRNGEMSSAPAGRWPTNVVIDEHTAAGIDAQSGITRDGTAVQRNGGGQRIFNNGDGMTRSDAGYGGEGGASRFFPTFRYEAKAPTTERPSYVREGTDMDSYRTRKRCTQCGKQRVNSTPTAQCQCPEPDFGPDPSQQGIVSHPTVKPLDLMRWLVRLVTPPGGVVLDPFAGSGTTAEACIHEHLRCITIEREPDYLPLIVARLSKPMEIGFNFGEGA